MTKNIKIKETDKLTKNEKRIIKIIDKDEKRFNNSFMFINVENWMDIQRILYPKQLLQYIGNLNIKKETNLDKVHKPEHDRLFGIQDDVDDDLLDALVKRTQNGHDDILKKQDKGHKFKTNHWAIKEKDNKLNLVKTKYQYNNAKNKWNVISKKTIILS